MMRTSRAILAILACGALVTAAGCSSGGSEKDASGAAGSGGATGSAGTSGSGGTTGSAGAVGTAGSMGSGGRGGAGGTAGKGGAGGAVACGGVTCGSNQVCVQPSCGGGVAVCTPLGDAGDCPTGWTMTNLCPIAGGAGCVPPPCTPPAPKCVDLPAACGGTPTCGCLPANVCALPNGQYGGSCVTANGKQVLCLSAAAN